MKTAVLIMAGGRGERFWPKSRIKMPKQFLELSDNGKTMIQNTVSRISSLVEVEDIFISTNNEYKGIVKEQLPEIPEENILCEPIGKNTAPCIGLGAVTISKKYGEAQMIILPSDHLIKYNNLFLRTIKDALEVSEKAENLVTIGITPDYPETGYGYIKFLPDKTEGAAFEVESFVEKPDLQKAREYLATEEYLWNSGMFIWKVSSILNNIKKYLPEMYSGLERIGEAINTAEYEAVLDREFSAFDSVSIDYGVLERAENIYTISGSFGWDDVGSWLAVGRVKKSDEAGNVIEGNVININSKDTIIQAESKLIAAVGLKDIIVVDTPDATLVCDKGCTADIKKVIENLKKKNRTEYI